MKAELEKYKFHPRVMEMRLAMMKNLIVKQYGEEIAMGFLKVLCEMWGCNWSLLIGIFNKDNKIINHSSVSPRRKKQEIIFMGYLYGETRYHISKHYLDMSTNYLYQSKEEHNPENYVDERWASFLDDEVSVCGVRSYSIEAKRFIISFDNFIGVFK